MRPPLSSSVHIFFCQDGLACWWLSRYMKKSIGFPLFAVYSAVSLAVASVARLALLGSRAAGATPRVAPRDGD